MAIRCEDFPCCGHSEPDDPCDPQAAGIKTAEEWARDPHLMCDHHNGICDAEEYDDEDDLINEDDEPSQTGVDANGYCRHGVYVGGCGPDYMCGTCEDEGYEPSGEDAHLDASYEES